MWSRAIPRESRRPLALSGAVPLVLACVACFVAGCGGGGSIATSSAGAIVRQNETGFSPDAVIVAAAHTPGPWIPAESVRSIDSDLTRIRSSYPVLQRVHTNGKYILTELVVTVRRDSSWVKAWQQGKTLSGNSAIDSFLSTYNIAKVEPQIDGLDNPWFILRFGQSLKVEDLAAPLKQLSADFLAVTPDYWNGGDNILLTEQGASRTYAFTYGWGDCPSGCISGHTWTVKLAQDGRMSMTESGSALPNGAP
jgi:hypothetical protein